MGAAVARFYRWVSSQSGGGASTPQTPALAVADKGDGTGANATITGSAGGSVTTVYSSLWTGLPGSFNWSSAGSSSGDGTIALGLATGSYFFTAVSSLSSSLSLPSNLVERILTGPPTLPASTLLGAIVAFFNASAVYPYFSASGGLWVEEVPEEKAFPLLCLFHNGEVPENTTEADYEESGNFQFELFAVGLGNAERLALILKQVFDPLASTPGSLTISNARVYRCERKNYKVSSVEGRDKSQNKVYQITIPFETGVRKTLGTS